MMNKKILIVASNYYSKIYDNLILGSKECLNKSKIDYQIINAPGCFEIPFLINLNKSYDGFVALGCIIRGETYHFEIISNEVSRKIMDLSIKLEKPIGFGILTCENLEQAIKRSDPNQSNKGAEATKACLEMLLIK